MGHLLQGLWRQLTLLARLEDYPNVPGVCWAVILGICWVHFRAIHSAWHGYVVGSGVASVYIHAPSSRIWGHREVTAETICFNKLRIQKMARNPWFNPHCYRKAAKM